MGKHMAKKRTYLGKKPFTPKPADLTKVQKESWKKFIEHDLGETIRSIAPIEDYTGKNWLLELGDIKVGKPSVTPEEAFRKDLSYSAPIEIEAKLTNKRKNKTQTEDVFLLNLPLMTKQGTFIISGIERCILNQLVRSPGVYFTAEEDERTGKILHEAEIRPLRGSWLEFLVSRRGIIYARIDRRRKFPATVIFRALGLESNRALLDTFGKFIQPTIEQDTTESEEEALLEFYQKIRPGEPAVVETARNNFRERFFDSRSYELGQVGRYKINKRLGLSFPDDKEENWILRQEDLISTVKYLIALQKGEAEKLDDIDHLGNRRIRQVGEIVVQVALRSATMRFERMVKERMSLASPTKDGTSPTRLVSSQVFTNAVNSFFRTNQLSSILEQTNPLSELDLLRRVTVLGPGGLSRERASFSIRDIHDSQYGRICPIRSPEGMNIGLVTYLALFAQINKYGFLEAPYRKVEKVKSGGKTKMKVTDEVIYLPADDEEEYYITHSGVNIDDKGYITEDWVPVRHQGEFFEAKSENLQLVDYVSQQVLGIAAALIPFVAHDEPQRALMGAHMLCQGAPLVQPESPIVGTGLEGVVARAMGWVKEAEESGTVEYVDGEKVIVKSKKDGKSKTYNIDKYRRTSPYGTCYSQRAVVEVGDKVKKGQMLIDGPGCQGGEFAPGKNLLIAYAPFEGLVYEDAIAISDRLLKDDTFTSIQIEEYEAEVVETKLGPEEVTRDIPNVAESDLANLTEDGIVMVGANVGAHDILVGKVEPKGEKELTAEERLLRAIFGEKAKDVKDTSLRIPHGEGGTVIDVNVLDRQEGDELDPGINKVIKVSVAQLRKAKVGDKLAGRHGNKGVISKIVPAQDMPYLEDGTPVDIVISPLSVIARMNLGQIMETHLGWAGKKLAKKYALPVFEALSEDEMVELLKEAGLPVDGKAQLYNGKTGRPYAQKSVVGINYIMKLIHMVQDKVHARSTGPYSLVTQQPLGGKARMGGQRLGEMEVWALEAHKASQGLQEMLTIKSDDITGRGQAFQSMIKGRDIPDPGIPESFKVMVKELAGLGLKVNPVKEG
jgi:DNA-directed RNA polymerase subunit beta